MKRRKAELESEIARLTAGLASGIHSPAVMAEIAKREREIAEFADRLLSSNSASVRSRVKRLRETAVDPDSGSPPLPEYRYHARQSAPREAY